ncbi:MAG: PAS domain S-box protein [Promethearchaeota archaeon]
MTSLGDRRLFDNAPDGIVLVNSNYNIVDVNLTIEKLTGYKRSEIINKKIFDIPAYDAHTLKFLRTLYKNIDEEVIPEFVEHQIIKKNGKKIWMDIKISSIRQGSKVFYQAILRDISSRKRFENLLRESEKKYRLIIENVHDLVTVLDKRFKHEYINETTYRKVLGYSKVDLLGNSVLKYIHPDDLPKATLKLFEGFKHGQGKNETRLKHKDGHWVWFESKGAIFHDSEGELKALIISRDISERKIVEKKLKQSEKNYRKSYERAKFYKDLFSHDMNNIIAAIDGYSQVYSMSKEYPDLTISAEELFSSIDRSLAKAKMLISNVRNLYQLESNKQIIFSKIGIIKSLEKAINYIKESFKQKPINITFESESDELFIKGNQFLINTFENILNNSVKYNENPIIQISIEVSRSRVNDMGLIRIEFIDNGIGIDDDRKKIVLQEGYNHKKGGRGLGFGLSVVKKIVNQFHGRIWVEDKINGDHTKGAKFILLFPEFVEK